ncbi:MAG: hypothetical protein IPK32_20200 [Verrucomicrobiaceae bacterium]|nr:hypothetical protein [Verrucomicrobiaceae bacterium]
MRHAAAVLLTLLLLTACEKPPAEVAFTDANIEMLDDGKTARYKSRPYTGMIRRTHSNGKAAGEYPYINGKMHGVMKEWWDNGQPSAETNFANGQRHGLNRYWDMKGKLTKEQMYDHDVSVSEKHF